MELSTSDSPEAPSALKAGDWTPQKPIPGGLRLENLRKVGIDEVRLHCRTPFPLVPVAATVLAIAIAIIGYAAGYVWLLILGPLAVLIHLAVGPPTAMPARWTIAVRPGELIVIDRRGLCMPGRTVRIPFSSIESICIASLPPDHVNALVITTSTGSASMGAGVSEDALQWLKNYLIMEFAGLTWKPISRSRECGVAASGDVIPNPVMLK